MLRNSQDLQGFMVKGTDGDVGAISEFYFDDDEWDIRYFVVTVSDLQIDRKVLLAPLALKGIDWDERIIYVNLSRSRILQSPEMDVDIPVSRQYELALRRYYEWPLYLGHMTYFDDPKVKREHLPGIPDEEYIEADTTGIEPPGEGDPDDFIPEEMESLMPGEPDDNEISEMEFFDGDKEYHYSPQLRSTGELLNSTVRTTEGEVGAISGVLIDDESWSVPCLLVRLGSNHQGPVVLMPFQAIRAIRWTTAEVVVDMTPDELKNSPQIDPSKPIQPAVLRSLYNYFDQLR